MAFLVRIRLGNLGLEPTLFVRSELEFRLKELDPHQEIVAYCHVGDRSIDACLVLWDAGFRKVRSMTGGIEAWSELVDPTVPRY